MNASKMNTSIKWLKLCAVIGLVLPQLSVVGIASDWTAQVTIDQTYTLTFKGDIAVWDPQLPAGVIIIENAGKQYDISREGGDLHQVARFSTECEDTAKSESQLGPKLFDQICNQSFVAQGTAPGGSASEACKGPEKESEECKRATADVADNSTPGGTTAAGDGSNPPPGGGDAALAKVPESIPELATPEVLIPGGEANGPLRSEGIMSGTDPYKRCQRLMTSSKKWSESIGNPQNDSQSSIFTKSWEVLFEEHKEKIVAKANENKGKDIDHNVKANLAKVFQAAVDAASTQYKHLNACVGLLMVTDDADNYSDEELKGVKDGKMTKKSMDGKIECKAAGPETQDWSACKTLLTTYNAAAIGQVVTQEAQKLDYMDKELDTQTDLMADGGKDPTKALKSQETMVRKQAQIANQRAAFHGAKLAALMAAKEAMPTKDQVYGECTGSNNILTSVGLLRKQYHHYVGALKTYAGLLVGTSAVEFKIPYSNTTDPGTNSTDKLKVNLQGSFSEAFPNGNVNIASLPDSDAAVGPVGDTWAYDSANGSNTQGQKFSDKNSVCDAAIYDGTNVIMNSKAIEQANMAMIQAGVDMAANVAKGQILDNQADRIADAADGIKQFDPGEMPMFQEEDAKVTACQADPTSAECLQLENTRGVGYAGSSFNFNGASRATTPGQISDDGDGSGDSSASSSNTNRGDVKSKMGRGIASINKGGGLDGIAGKAGVKKGGNPAEAGGGGGGGGGGAAPPSGGGVRGGGGAGGARSAYSASKVRYRGGAGGLSFSGSGRGSSSAKKKSDNPFASLLGKKGGKGGTMDGFRNPASIGAQNGSLFQMISKRYSVVAEKKQLLEYEDVK
jgi:hypothetical protein